MGKTLEEIVEGPILLTWEMPAWKRQTFGALPFLIAAVVIAVSVMLTFRYKSTGYLRIMAIALPFAYWLVGANWLLKPFWHAATMLEVTADGIRVMTATRVRMIVPWADARVMRRGTYGFAVLSNSPRSVYLPIPPDVRDKLIAILRETSNARIVGFGPEES